MALSEAAARSGDKNIHQSILLPFSNGDIATVSLSVYKAPKGQTRPVDAYVVTECEGDFTGAARRAAEAVYNLARNQLPHVKQMVIGLDVQGFSNGSAPVTGDSGGLAFALAIAGELFHSPRRAIAATGAINNSAQGKVASVDGIAGKLCAVAKIIPSEGCILYPRDNHKDIPETVFQLAREKRLTLHPVTCIAEAIYAAYGIELENEKTRKVIGSKKMASMLIAAAIAMLFVSTLFILKNRSRETSPVDPAVFQTGPAIHQDVSPQTGLPPDMADAADMGDTAAANLPVIPQTAKADPPPMAAAEKKSPSLSETALPADPPPDAGFE